MTITQVKERIGRFLLQVSAPQTLHYINGPRVPSS